MNYSFRVIYKLTHSFVRLYWKICKPKTYGSRAVIICDGKVLLVKNINVSHWSLPGGKIDTGENPEQCIIRELHEELNLQIEHIDYKLGEYFSEKEGKRDTIYIFVIKIPTLTFTKQWELEEADWFEVRNLPHNTSPAARKRVTDYLSEQKEIIGKW